MKLLTKRQREIRDFIIDCIGKRQRPPTVREIGDHFGISSPNGITCHLKALEKKGAIKRDKDKSCGIRVKTGIPLLTEKLISTIDTF